MTTELSQLHDLFGTRLLLMQGGAAVLYGLWSTAPFWWPALIAFRRGRNMVKRGSFLLTAAALAYGSTAMLALAAGGVALLARVLQETVQPEWVAAIAPALWAATHVISWFTPIVMTLHLALAVVITHYLARHWHVLCARASRKAVMP